MHVFWLQAVPLRGPDVTKDLSTQQKLPPIWTVLHRVQASLACTDVVMAELLEVNIEDFKYLKTTHNEPTLRSTFCLARAVNVGWDALVMGEIDYTVMSKQWSGQSTYMPEKYLENACTKRRVSTNILSYVESKLGWERRGLLLRNLQLTEPMFSDPENLISTRFSIDVFAWLFKYCRHEDILLDLGRGILHTPQNAPVSHFLNSQARNLDELLDLFVGDVVGRFFESNYAWRIESKRAFSVTIRGVPNLDVIPRLGTDYANKSHFACVVRKGLISAIPTYLGYTFAPIAETSCVCHGQPFCEFRVDLEPLIRDKRAHTDGGRHLRTLQ